jgi:hypothetical protein
MSMLPSSGPIALGPRFDRLQPPGTPFVGRCLRAMLHRTEGGTIAPYPRLRQAPLRQLLKPLIRPRCVMSVRKVAATI